MIGAWEETASVRTIVVISGALVVESPLSIGTGEGGAGVDHPVLRDVDGRPFVPGTTLAGALKARSGPGAEDLFGSGDDAGRASALIFDDALAEGSVETEVRDHVRLDPETGTAASGLKFDREAIAVGARFGWSMEWHLDRPLADAPGAQVDRVLDLVRHLHEGVAIGGRTRRGLGRVRVEAFAVETYDLAARAELARWAARSGPPAPKESPAGVAKALGRRLPTTPLEPDAVRIRLRLAVRDSLLIRSAPGKGTRPTPGSGRKPEKRPDTVALRRAVHGKPPEPVVPGSSLAGALRHRAEAICATAGRDKALVSALFGSPPEPRAGGGAAKLRPGRLTVSECPVRGGSELRHTRVAIDPWTGGALDGFLFTEDAWYGGEVDLALTLRGPTAAELGLLALALRDLWEGDLPIGGEVGVGRGVLLGRSGEVDGQPLAFDGAGRLTKGLEVFRPWVAAFQGGGA